MTDANYHLLPRTSSDLDGESPRPTARRSSGQTEVSYLRTVIHLPIQLARKCRSRRRLCIVLYIVVPFLLVVLGTAIFNPSYTSPPPFLVPADENVYIAANIVDDDLVRGPWGDALVALTQKFPPGQVYVSVYGGPTSAMEYLSTRLRHHGVPSTIVSEALSPVNTTMLAHVVTPDGSRRIKRIEFLAQVRNRALSPLEKLHKRYHKVLFLNDVVFSPDDALRLMFSTRAETVENEDGSVAVRTNYRAACAIDYDNPFKFYDTYATRDTDGYYAGLPIFPYFTSSGSGTSRRDMLEGRDAVRVKSCWGGMVSYDGRFFQSLPPPLPSNATTGGVVTPVDEAQVLKANATREAYEMWLADMYGADEVAQWSPVRFRAEPHPFWDASECCLVNADVGRDTMVVADAQDDESLDTGIYINPYVRVAYDRLTYDFLWLSRRLERLLIMPQALINSAVHLPSFNARRLQQYKKEYKTKVWVPSRNQTGESVNDYGVLANDGESVFYGHYEDVVFRAGKGGFCGVRHLLVFNEADDREDVGGRNWRRLPIPIEEEGEN